jgi:hypothetical protein
MDGKFLDGPSVRRLEKMPNKLQLLTSVAVMIKKACRLTAQFAGSLMCQESGRLDNRPSTQAHVHCSPLHAAYCP